MNDYEKLRESLLDVLKELIDDMPCVDTDPELFVESFTDKSVEPVKIEYDEFLDYVEEEFGEDFKEKIPDELEKYVKQGNGLAPLLVMSKFIEDTTLHLFEHKMNEMEDDIDKKFLSIFNLFIGKKAKDLMLDRMSSPPGIADFLDEDENSFEDEYRMFR